MARAQAVCLLLALCVSSVAAEVYFKETFDGAPACSHGSGLRQPALVLSSILLGHLFLDCATPQAPHRHRPSPAY